MANKDAYYFSHDSNALTDPKILSLYILSQKVRKGKKNVENR